MAFGHAIAVVFILDRASIVANVRLPVGGRMSGDYHRGHECT